MRFGRLVLLGAAFFLLGIAVTVVAGKARTIDRAVYEGKPAKEAASSLLEAAEAQAARNGSWELIAVGRMHYLSGDKVQGQALFDKAISKKAAESDWKRIGSVYLEAREWDKAEAAFQKALQADPHEDHTLILLGIVNNLNGNRKKAEEFFARAFERNSEEVWNTVDAAGSYLGVGPNP